MVNNDILDEYECQECGGGLRRRIVFDNIVCQDEIKFCPFCGEKYNNEKVCFSTLRE